MTRRGRDPAEVRERAVRMVFEREREHSAQWATISSIASELGVTTETLRTPVRRAEVDGGARPGQTTEERDFQAPVPNRLWVADLIVLSAVPACGPWL